MKHTKKKKKINQIEFYSWAFENYKISQSSLQSFNYHKLKSLSLPCQHSQTSIYNHYKFSVNYQFIIKINSCNLSRWKKKP